MTGLTLCLVALDLLLYEKITGTFTFLFLLAVYTRFTFPKGKSKFKIFIWSITTILILFSGIVGENAFIELLPYGSGIILILAYLWAVFSKEHHRVPSPFEIQFYDDYLIVYRENTIIVRRSQEKNITNFFIKILKKSSIEHKTKG